MVLRLDLRRLGRGCAILALCGAVILVARGTETLSRWLATPVRAQSLIGTASVIDGDTLEIHGQRIRLHGIDAPESGQSCADASGQRYRCGQRAALDLSDQIGGRPVTCDQRDRDRYGRVIGVCLVGRTDLNAWMVETGHAVAYRRYSPDYVAAEQAARAAGRGLWAGSFVMPWDWRRGERL